MFMFTSTPSFFGVYGVEMPITKEKNHEGHEPEGETNSTFDKDDQVTGAPANELRHRGAQ